MPRYTVEDINTEDEIELEMSLEELEQLLQANPNLRQVFKLNLCYRIGRLPVSEDWRAKLKAMKKANPRSTIEIP